MAYTLIVSTKAGSLNADDVTTPGVDTTGANLIVVHVAEIGGTSGTLSDSKGNSWTNLTAANSSIRSSLWYAAGPTVGSGHTFTVSGRAASYPAITVLAFSGAVAIPHDQENAATGSGTTIQPGSVTPLQDNELLVVGINAFTSTSWTIDGGFTVQETVAFVDAKNYSTAIAYLVQTTAAAANPTWTLSGSQTFLANAIATFKATSVSGNPLLLRLQTEGLFVGSAH